MNNCNHRDEQCCKKVQIINCLHKKNSSTQKDKIISFLVLRFFTLKV